MSQMTHRTPPGFNGKLTKKRILVGIAALALSLSGCLPALFSGSATYCFLPISSCPLIVSLPIGSSCFCSGAPGIPGIAG